jgi:hypothetical protein
LGQCKIIRGTSWELPDGMTLVTVKHQPGKAWYVERPKRWDQPALLSVWEDTQTFNAANGQQFTITVYLAPLEQVRSEKARPENNPTWALTSIPVTWEQLAYVGVTVDSTHVPSECSG